MCHIQYVDDLLLLSTSGIEDLTIMKLILIIFEGLSGLAAYFQKNYLYFPEFWQYPFGVRIPYTSLLSDPTPGLLGK